MKKSLYFAATALLAASCASDEIVEETNNGYQPDTKAPISFITNQKNITRAQDLNKVGHYNFGVFAYKSTEAVNNIMDNYLVGFNGTDEAGNDVGYYMTTTNQTTLGDAGGYVDGQSMWQYEKLGNTEYEYAGEGYYKASQTEYMSNVDKQYLRYWDFAANTTTFYAYSPYINGTGTASYNNATKVMTIPDGSLTDGYNDPALCEYMYATTTVNKADYGKDVRLEFKRLNAKVNIKFWEDIEGYSVRILDLNSSNEGVQAAPSIKEAGQGKYGYKKGEYFKKNGVTINFSGTTPVVAQTTTTATDKTPLIFAAPTVDKIGETRLEASKSETDYYAIPKNNTTGFTFHVTYELTSTTGERIVVRNATVHVPVAYTNWDMNTHYTYIFKITSNSNGSTMDPTDPNAPTVDPTDPEVPTESALYPIIFDNCTVEEWVENESEWNITDGTKLSYYDVQLSKNSIATGNIDVTISVDNLPAGETIDYANVTVVNKATGAADAKVTYDASTKKITVADGAATGVYTVTYTCHTTAAGDGNHPSTWSEYFVVGNAYTVSTNLSEVGTGGKDVAKLAITTTKDNSAEATPTGTFKIEYPKNLTDDGKVAVSGSNVTVATDAAEGSYVLAYVVDGNIVSRKEFKVVKYSLVLSQNVVGLNNPAVVVNAEKRGSITGTISMATATGITVNDAAGTITVANTAATGDYTVVYTVNGDNASKIVYEQTLTLKNTYAVSLSATQIDHDASPAGSITITTKKNGDAISGQTANLSVVSASGAAVSGITISDAQVLTVTSAVAPGNYKVVYTGETGVTAEVEFTVVD